MLLQAIGIMALIWAKNFAHFAAIGAILGMGTALVYPTFLSAISDYTNPFQRAESLGIFRFWRDLGYAFGAFLTGLIADFFGLNTSIIGIGLLTVLSALVVLFRMK